MRKIEKLDDAIIEEIVLSYLEHPYSEGEKSPFSLLGSRRKMEAYLTHSIRTAVSSGWLYGIGENDEAYVAINRPYERPSICRMLAFMLTQAASVGPVSFIRLARAARAEGERPLIEKLKSRGQDFIHVDLLCVLRPFQGLGYARLAVDEVKRLAIREHLPVVLETDDRAKAGMYEHFGFSLVQTRTLACGVHYYEMIWRGDGSPSVNWQ